MRIAWWWGAAVLAAGALAGCGTTAAKDPDVQPALALEIRAGSLLDPKDATDVPLTLWLANAGDKPAFVNTRMLVNSAAQPHEVVLTVLGPDKKPLPFNALVNARRESRDWKTLPPGGGAFV